MSDLLHTAMVTQTKEPGKETDSTREGGTRTLTGMEKLAIDEQDRRLGAAIRREPSHEGRVNALTGSYGADQTADIRVSPNEAAIVPAGAHDTHNDRSRQTDDSNEWHLVKDRMRRTRIHESTGGIVLPH
jgi:hypothetical protein